MANAKHRLIRHSPFAHSSFSPMVTKSEIAADWLTRYTGMPLDEFGKYVLLTNFRDYVTRFAKQFSCNIYGDDRPMQAATNDARPDDHQLRHRLAQRGDDHGPAHRLPPRGGAVPRQVRRAQAHHRNRPLHPADRRDPRRRNVRRLPAAAGARAAVVQAPQVRLAEARRPRPRVPHRRDLHHQSPRLGARREIPRAVAGILADRHRHGNGHDLHRRPQEPDRPRGAAPGLRQAAHARRRENHAKATPASPATGPTCISRSASTRSPRSAKRAR